MSTLAACTIASNNYLAFVKVFVESYRKHHPGAPVYVCIADRPDPGIDYDRFDFIPIFAEDLQIPGFRNFAFRYDILELNTGVKPYLLTHLRDRYGLSQVLYFDPDILVLDRLHEVEEVLATHSLAMTPHVTKPLDNARRPAERAYLVLGIYNLGFLGIRLDASTADFLSWWEQRLLRYCLNSPEDGLFVDQAWMDFAPALLDSVALLRQPRFNVAYWNLPHRRLEHRDGRWLVEGTPVGFFHFSGIELHSARVSKHEDRLTPVEAREVEPLFEEYRRRIREAGHSDYCGHRYGYATFEGTEITIPGVLRRALHQNDPEGRRWPDPFDPTTADSFFRWLVEPIVFPGGCLNRASLALWEGREDLRRRYPEVLGRDLPGYVVWLRREGAAREGLLAFVQALPKGMGGRSKRIRPGRAQPPVFEPPESVDVLIGTLDLRHPGERTQWLNDPIPGTTAARPTLTRLALSTHRGRADLQEAYPDPLGEDQLAFAVWFCTDGRRELALHEDLVRPVRRSLPLRRRLGIWYRSQAVRTTGPTADGRGTTAVEGGRDEGTREEGMRDIGEIGTQIASPPPSPPVEGVNVISGFYPDTTVGAAARATVAALEKTGIPFVSIRLDEDVAAKRSAGRLLQPQGAPFTVNLLHVEVDELARSLAALPFQAAATGVNVACWDWELAHLPLWFADLLAQVDEVWAPCRFSQRAFESLAPVPVRWMPPPVLEPQIREPDRGRFGLDAHRRLLYAVHDARGVEELQNPSGLFETARRLELERPGEAGVVLQVLGAKDAPRRVDALREAARDLPVTLLTTAESPEERLALLASCEAFLSLHRSQGWEPMQVTALLLEKPLVATGYGGVTDLLDAASGYPVAYRLCSLAHDHYRYPRGAVWAEPDVADAVEKVLRVLDSTAEAQAKADEGAQRARRLHGMEAATRRWHSELRRASGRGAPGASPRKSKESGGRP